MQGQLSKDHPFAAKYRLIFGSGFTNAFDPPVQMSCHTASVIQLCLILQRRRREPQRIAEVGVWQGQSARWILSALPFVTMHLIDPWAHPGTDSSWYQKGDRFAKAPQEEHDAHFEQVRMLCEQFAPRAIQHRATSTDAAPTFAERSFDLVFIDGAHNKENVMADIHAWRSKVRPGGYLSGHDYRKGGNYFGCVAGIEQATAELGLTIECFPGKVWACRIPQ